MDTWARRLSLLLAGAAALAGAAWLRTGFAGLEGTPRHLAVLLPPALAAAGAALAAWFHRDRPVFLQAVLAAAYLLPLLYRPTAAGGSVLFDGLALAVPANLLLFGLLPERGLASAAAFGRLGLVALQAGLLAAAVSAPAQPLGRLVAQPPAFPGTALGSGSLVLFGLAGVSAAALLIRRGDTLQGGILVAAGATGWALHAGGEPGAVVAGWALAHLGLLAAQVQESYRLAFVDGLTGLPGRRALEEQLARLGGAHAVAMVDVDRFKRFNDRHGHAAGDQVLRLVARRLARVGEGGRAFRYGGEEFAVIFPGRGAAEAAAAMETVRAAVADSPFRLRQGGRDRNRRGRGGGREVRVTVSAGVADSDSAGEPLRQADRALYRAKRQGRNRVRH
ncbi:MAG TPA: GGDEF domain-containing protein [Gammaproteobacteria bacterium]|nr:GGDEF domain-containing protein [Gammaproteobacteria bacterium]